MRLLFLGLLCAAAVLLTSGGHNAQAITAPRVAPAVSVGRQTPDFAAFRSRLGFGSRGRYGYRYGYARRSPGLVHRVIRTAIWLYVLHLFFTHGGLSILLWILVIAVVFSLMRRRRRYAYRPRSFGP
jgi:hypothetical protein